MRSKKTVTFMAIALVLVLVCGCGRPLQKDSVDESYNLEVTAEPFEKMQTTILETDYYGYNSEQELYDSASLVFIGMPTDTFTECEAKYYDLNEENELSSDEHYFSSYTLRNVKVLQVIKGDSTLKNITVAERGTVRKNDEGQSIISHVPQGYSIAKKNAKYLYYVKCSGFHSFYMAKADGGKINIDGLDQKSNLRIDEKRINEVKTRYTAEFEKYDRSNELESK